MLHEILNWILVAEIDWINNSTWWRGTWKSLFCHREKNWERRISIVFLRIASRRLLDVETECFVIFLFSCLLSSNWSLLRGQQSRCIEKHRAKKKKINWIALNVFQKSFKDSRILFSPFPFIAANLKVYEMEIDVSIVFYCKKFAILRKNNVIRHKIKRL